MKNKIISYSIALVIILLLQNCKKKEDQQSNEDITTQILNDYSVNVVMNGYQQLELKSIQMHQDILLLVANTDQILLQKCQEDWKSTRKVWEESEACLFGPVSTNSIDPRIDTWPVDFNRLDTILNGTAVFSQTYIDNLEESLKGFHSIEYLLFGRGGSKSHTHFTTRQKDFLLALSENLQTLTGKLRNDWDPQGGNYINDFINAGNGSTLYPTKKSAFEEVILAMVGICDEVANGKIGEVASTLDSMKEESPFAKNSLIDFTNNIHGVMNCYQSKNSGSDGKGLEDFVRQYNLSLDAAIKQKHNSAIAALQNITVPFGEAIFTQPIQVQNAIVAINALKEELENNLLPLVKLHIH